MSEKDKALDAGAEIEVAQRQLSYEDGNAHKTAIHRAKAATDKEQSMSLWVGIKTYPKAIGWSMIISLCIAMEAFDLCLVNTFCKSNNQNNAKSLTNTDKTVFRNSKNNSANSNPTVATRSQRPGKLDSETDDKQLNSSASSLTVGFLSAMATVGLSSSVWRSSRLGPLFISQRTH